MSIKNLFSLCLLLTSLTSYSQVTTFKDTRWFDYKTNTSSMYRKPVNQPTAVLVSADSIIANLGTKTYRYKVKSVSESPKNFTTKYIVDLNGVEKTIVIARINESAVGGPDRTVAMINGYFEWYVFAPLTSIIPIGYVFPGEPKINISEEREKIPGYYEFSTVTFPNKADAYKEVNDCQQDILIDLGADNKGSWVQGTRAKNCKKEEQSFTWRLEDVVIKGKHTLILFLDAGLDSKELVVTELTKSKLEITGDFRFGSDDSTMPASIELKKKKKK